MSLLDDLKKKADEKEKRRVGEGDGSRQRAERNWHVLSPRMTLAFNYLRDLAENLNVVLPQDPCEFQLTDNIRLRGLTRSEYRVARRDTDSLQTFEFRYNLVGPHTYEISLPNPQDAAKLRPVLEAQPLTTYGERVDGSRIAFSIDAKIIVCFNFTADLDACVVQLTMYQFGRAWTQKLRFSPDQVTEALMDEMGKMILGYPTQFMEMSGNAMSDAAREMLRNELNREREATTVPRAVAADESARGRGLFGLLKK